MVTYCWVDLSINSFVNSDNIRRFFIKENTFKNVIWKTAAEKWRFTYASMCLMQIFAIIRKEKLLFRMGLSAQNIFEICCCAVAPVQKLFILCCAGLFRADHKNTYCTVPPAQKLLIVCCAGPFRTDHVEKYLLRGSSRTGTFHNVLRVSYHADHFEKFLLRGSLCTGAFHCVLHGNLPRSRVFLPRRICTYSLQTVLQTVASPRASS